MDFKHIKVSEVLSIDNVELYQTSGQSGSLITKGVLYVLYSQEHDWYILKVNDFNYGVAKCVPILASSHERGAARAYVVPNPQGYFIIKVTRALNQENLSRFEDILKKVAQFAEKENGGLPVKLGDQTVTVEREALTRDPMEQRAQTSAAHLIYNGGKATRHFLVDTAQGISNGISKLGGHVQANQIEKPEAKIQPNTARSLALLSSATGMVASTSTFYMKGLTSLGNWIGQKIETKFEKKTAEKEASKMRAAATDTTAQTQTQTQPEGPDGVIGVGYATIYSAISIWQGMLEALDIIREGFSETASGLVSQKYGPVAGEVLRAGINVAGKGVFKRK